MAAGIPAPLRHLLPDVDRIHNVPGVALRRALFLCDTRAIDTLRFPLRTGTEDASTPPLLTTSLTLLDWTAVPTFQHGSTEMKKLHESTLGDCVDVLVVAAAEGDCEYVQLLFHSRAFSEIGNLAKHVTRMVEVACVKGQHDFITWLQTALKVKMARRGRRLDWIQPSIDKGMARAVAVLEIHTASHLGEQQHYDHDTTEPVDGSKRNDRCVVHETSNLAVVAVLTNRHLMTQVGSFQERPLDFVTAYELMIQGYQATGKDEGVPVHHAIIHNDMPALKMIYMASIQQRDETKLPKLSFRLAMHVAACEGRLELLQWLHSRSLSHPEEITCRVDILAMAVRCGWAQVVEWLHLNRPESAVSMSAYAVNHAAHWGHIDVLRVCYKYQLGAITEKTMISAARAGHVEIVRWLCSLEDRALSRQAALDVAIEHGRVDVVSYLREDCNQTIDSLPHHSGVTSLSGEPPRVQDPLASASLHVQL